MASLKTVGICDTQPVTIEGLESLLRGSRDMQVVGSATNLFSGLELVQMRKPSIVVIDKAFGMPAIMDWLSSLRSTGAFSVVWGVSLNEAEALRIMQAGAQGVIRKTADSSTVLSCLRTVATGATWMEDSLLGDGEKTARNSRSNLTPREHQVVELVEQGLKEQRYRPKYGNPAGNGENSPQAHLREDRYPRALWLGSLRIARKRAAVLSDDLNHLRSTRRNRRTLQSDAARRSG
jgi:DNA-binding NarL/FixJ family response regulator